MGTKSVIFGVKILLIEKFGLGTLECSDSADLSFVKM